MHLEIPQVTFAICAMDSIGQLPTVSKGDRFALIFTNILFNTVPLKTETADEVSMAYIKEILPKASCSKFILQENQTEFKNKQLMTIFDTLDIKRIYSNPYFPRGNSRIENVHNFLKRTVAIFMHGSQLKWNDALPLATYCYNIAPSVDDAESPFYLVHGRDPLEGRLSNLHNCWRYVGDQPGQLAVQELRKCGNYMQNYWKKIEEQTQWKTIKSLKQVI